MLGTPCAHVIVLAFVGLILWMKTVTYTTRVLEKHMYPTHTLMDAINNDGDDKCTNDTSL